MNRRGFISSLFKTAVIAVVAPTIINNLDKFASTPKVTSVMYGGKEYWIDWAMYQVEQQWMKEQEELMWRTHRPFLKDELQ